MFYELLLHVYNFLNCITLYLYIVWCVDKFVNNFVIDVDNPIGV